MNRNVAISQTSMTTVAMMAAFDLRGSSTMWMR